VSAVQQYLRARLIDDMHVAVVPVLLGSGERLFDHLDGGPVGYECVEFASSPSALHVRFARTGPGRLSSTAEAFPGQT
jgi:dihydrofolate reductase